MGDKKRISTPYPTEETRPYPPPYEENHPTNSFAINGRQAYPPYPPQDIPLGPIGVSQVNPPYPAGIPAAHPLPYLPTAVPPVTSPPSMGHYPPQPPPMGGVTSVHIIETSRTFGSESQYVRCPNCGQSGFTNIESKVTAMTHFIALILCIFMLWPIVWLPYACSTCQSTVHNCSNCNNYLGERNL